MSAAHSNEQAEGCTLFRAVERDRLCVMPVFIQRALRSDVDCHVCLLSLFLVEQEFFQ